MSSVATTSQLKAFLTCSLYALVDPCRPRLPSVPRPGRMLVECGPEAVLAAVTVKKSATENSQLNKQRSYRHVGRYSGSFSPPGEN